MIPQQQDGQPGAGSGVGQGQSTPRHPTDGDIEHVLKSSKAREPFYQFLQQQFCSENINFYLSVEDYRKIPETAVDERVELGRQIFDRHFATNCIEPVNIDNSAANNIRNAYRIGDFRPDLFDVVQYQIFHLLKYDCWPRYVRAGGHIAEELGGDAPSSAGSRRTGSDAPTDSDVVRWRRASSKRWDASVGATLGMRRKSLFRFLRDRLNVADNATLTSPPAPARKMSAVRRSPTDVTAPGLKRVESAHDASSTAYDRQEEPASTALSDSGCSCGGPDGMLSTGYSSISFKGYGNVMSKSVSAAGPLATVPTGGRLPRQHYLTADFDAAPPPLTRLSPSDTSDTPCSCQECTKSQLMFFFAGSSPTDGEEPEPEELPLYGTLASPPSSKDPKDQKRRGSMAALGRRLSAGFVRKFVGCGIEPADRLASQPPAADVLAAPITRRSFSCSPRTVHSTAADKNAYSKREPSVTTFGDLSASSYHRFGALREPVTDGPARTCTLLTAECGLSKKITLIDQLQSVKQWTVQMAQRCGLDGNATEVVDAQTGATIDPTRQAVDALNNRTIRLMPVVRLPVIFQTPPPLAPAGAGGPSNKTLPHTRVVILRARSSLTVNKVVTPIMLKFNVEPTDAIICLAGSCEPVDRQTTIGALAARPVCVMTGAQYADRRATYTKRDYQKELNSAPIWLCAPPSLTSSGQSSGSTTSMNAASQPVIPSTSLLGSSAAPPSAGPDGLTFQQHGDVGYLEWTLESEAGRGLKHNATRSHSTNPKEFFKFGRKPSQARASRGFGLAGALTGGGSFANHYQTAAATAASSSPSGSRAKSVGSSGGAAALADRRKSVGATASHSPVGARAAVATGGTSSSSSSTGNSYKLSGLARPPPPRVEKSDIPYCGEDQSTAATARGATPPRTQGSRYAFSYDIPEFLKTELDKKSGANGAAPHLPAIYTSRVRADRDGIHDIVEGGSEWQKADYV